MITSKEVKIKISDEFSSQYVDSELKKQGYIDVLSWAIIGYDEEFYILNILIVIS